MSGVDVQVTVVGVYAGDDTVGATFTVGTEMSDNDCGLGERLEPGATWMWFLDSGQTGVGSCGGDYRIAGTVEEAFAELDAEAEAAAQ